MSGRSEEHNYEKDVHHNGSHVLLSIVLGLQTELTSNDQTLNLRCAFANFAQLGVAQESFGREIFYVAIAAVDLNAKVADLGSNFRSKQFCLRPLKRYSLVIIFHPSSMIKQHTSCSYLRGHIGKIALDKLEFADRLTKSFTLLRIA